MLNKNELIVAIVWSLTEQIEVSCFQVKIDLKEQYWNLYFQLKFENIWSGINGTSKVIECNLILKIRVLLDSFSGSIVILEDRIWI